MRMASFGDLIARLLYPPNAVCIVCGRMRVDAMPWGLCAACAALLQPPPLTYCPRCEHPMTDDICPSCAEPTPDALDACLSAYAYANTARGLVRALKYKGVAAAAEALADGMALLFDPDAYDLLVPVPLHSRRQRTRGFNQAAMLCLALNQRTGLPTGNALLRVRNTRTQTSLSREGRAQNVDGAFVASEPVTGRALLLVDDVLTTGATGHACARALKADGARRVVLLTAARATIRKDD